MEPKHRILEDIQSASVEAINNGLHQTYLALENARATAEVESDQKRVRRAVITEGDCQIIEFRA